MAPKVIVSVSAHIPESCCWQDFAILEGVNELYLFENINDLVSGRGLRSPEQDLAISQKLRK